MRTGHPARAPQKRPMSKILVIAEKPSVAADIVRALTPHAGKFEKHAEYFENDKYIVTSAVGHLVEIKAPEEFDVKRGKWSFAHLPVIPPHFDLAPIDKAKTRLNAVVKLVKRKDVTALINACDAGREGELIFRLIVQYAGSGKAAINKPIKRLWLQSMTPQAIRDGFEQLRSDEELLGLSDAARSRSEAGEYDGKWFDPKWKKNPDDAELRADRLWTEADAQAIAQAVRGQPASVSEEAKPSTQSAPGLYDLTTLQREANSRFGFSAKTTLSIAQALYEKHKVLTYPRTDSRFLPEDYVAVAKDTAKMLATEDLPGPLALLSQHAAK